MSLHLVWRKSWRRGIRTSWLLFLLDCSWYRSQAKHLRALHSPDSLTLLCLRSNWYRPILDWSCWWMIHRKNFLTWSMIYQGRWMFWLLCPVQCSVQSSLLMSHFVLLCCRRIAWLLAKHSWRSFWMFRDWEQYKLTYHWRLSKLAGNCFAWIHGQWANCKQLLDN